MKVKIGFFGILMFLSLLISRPAVSCPALLAATLHELGHIGMAKLCHIHLSELKLGIFGAGLVMDRKAISYSKEILLCLAGPCVNFGVAFLLWTWNLTASRPFFETLCLSSLALGTLNLLPVHGFDGGRSFEALLCLWLRPSIAERITHATSFGVVFLLWSFSLYLLLRTSNSLSLFVFSLALFSKLFLLPSCELPPKKSEESGETERKPEKF